MGSITTFNTSVKKPFEAVRCHFEPKQDLHGYNKPWPAGGGKNILDMSDENIVLGKYINNGGNVIGNINNFYNSAYVPVNSSTAYTLSMSQNVGYCSIMEYDSSKTFIKRTLFGSSSTPKISSATITTNNDTAYVLIGSNLNGTAVDLADVKAINWQLEQGSTATTYAPYENLCTITGFDSVTVNHTGKNICGGEALASTIVDKVQGAAIDTVAKTVRFEARYATGIDIITGIFKPNTQYTFILKGYNTGAYQATNLRVNYTDGSYVNPPRFNNGISIISTLSGKTVASVRGVWDTSQTYLYYEQCGIFEGVLTAQDFEPYIGESATVEFGETAYGGSYEFVDGNHNLNMVAVDLGSLSWYKNANLFQAQLPNSKHINTTAGLRNAMCEMYPLATSGYNLYYGIEDKAFIINSIFLGSQERIYVRDSAYTTAQDFKAAVSGIKVVFEVEEPVESIIPSGASFTAYRGLNNVWHDLNGDIDVDYVAKDHATPAEYRNKILLNTPHIEEQSGDVAAFSTDIKGRLKGAEVTLVPEQDLNGYDYPWPAGGGVNILPNIGDSASKNGYTSTYDSETGIFTINGSLTGSSALLTLADIPAISWNENDYYALSVKCVGGSITAGEGTGITWAFAVFSSDNAKFVRGSTTDASMTTSTPLYYGRGIGFIASAYKLYLQVWRAGTVANNLKVKVQLEKIASASATPSAWSPYSNICPITGHTSAKVYDDPVLGQEIEFNQLTLDGNFPSVTNWGKVQSYMGNLSASGNVLTMELTENTLGYSEVINGGNNTVQSQIGHVYYFSVDVKSAGWASSGNKLLIRSAGYWVWYPTMVPVTLPTDTWYSVRYIWRGCNQSVGLNPSIRKYNDDNLTPLYVRNYMVIDLTQMFGAGNEPSTVAEFQSLFPASYYPYNTGEKTTVSAVNGDPCWEAEVELPVTGKNLMDFIGREQNGVTGTNVNGVAHIVGTATAAAYPIDGVAITLPAGTYKWSCSNVPSGVSMQWSKDGAWAGWVTDQASFTLAAPTSVGMYIRVESGTTVDADIWFQLEAGSTSTSFVPYSDETYGAKVNLVTGECTVTDIRMHVSRATGMTMGQRLARTGGYYFYKTLTDNHCSLVASQIAIAATAEHFTHGVINNPYTEDTYCAWVYKQDARYSYVRVGLPNSLGIDTVEKFNTWLDAQGGVDVSYPLETPRTFYLTPQELQQLRGQNNIFSPDGQIKVRYWTHRKEV